MCFTVFSLRTKKIKKKTNSVHVVVISQVFHVSAFRHSKTAYLYIKPHLRHQLSATAILGAGVVNLSVRTHALIAAGHVDAVHVRLARRVQTLVDVHALASELPETFGTPATVTAAAAAASTVLRILHKKITITIIIIKTIK